MMMMMMKKIIIIIIVIIMWPQSCFGNSPVLTHKKSNLISIIGSAYTQIN